MVAVGSIGKLACFFDFIQVLNALNYMGGGNLLVRSRKCGSVLSLEFRYSFLSGTLEYLAHL